MLSEPGGPAIVRDVAHSAGLVAFGVLFGALCDAMVFWLPRPVYFDASFTLSLIEEAPLALAFAVASLGLVLWLCLPAGRSRFSWTLIDRVGGLRWLCFAIAMTLTWTYAAHPYNYFFDRSHAWDRWLLVLLTLGILRSPLLIPVFALEVTVSRVQFSHPINSMSLITDQLPIRILGTVVGCVLWNGCLDCLEALRSTPRRALAGSWALPAPIRTRSLIHAMLCMIGFYYAFAGIGKLMLGASPTDWIRFSHLENLHVSSHLNGWLSSVPETQILEIAQLIRPISPVVSAATLAIELGMITILWRQRGTLLLLAAVCSMHLGILITTGIFFWKWMALELSLLAWLWLRRDHVEIRHTYSTRSFVASLVIIAVLTTGLSRNDFAWWNTKWTMLYEIELLDESGHVYRFDYADLPTYELFNLYMPRPGATRNTIVYGMSKNQRLMQMLEEGEPTKLERYAELVAEHTTSKANRRSLAVFGDFMTTYFRNRNKGHAGTVPPFWISAPAKNIRHASGPDVYRDQAPVVEVRLRFVEVYFTGKTLQRMRDEIVHSLRVPP